MTTHVSLPSSVYPMMLSNLKYCSKISGDNVFIHIIYLKIQHNILTFISFLLSYLLHIRKLIPNSSLTCLAVLKLGCQTVSNRISSMSLGLMCGRNILSGSFLLILHDVCCWLLYFYTDVPPTHEAVQCLSVCVSSPP